MITQAEHQAAQAAAAADAMARGQAAFGAGDLLEAERWLDRARRIAGGNDAVELLLETVRLRLGRADPAVFAALAARHDLREAWLGLAAAHHQSGAHEAAAVALGRALADHAGPAPPALMALAAAIAGSVGAAGWCWVESGEGPVQVAPAGLAVSIEDLPAGGIRSTVVSAVISAVSSAGGTVLGSPLRRDRMARLEGFVEASDHGGPPGGLTGFAWYPNDPGRVPVLHVRGAAGTLIVPAGGEVESSGGQRHDRPLARRRRFGLTMAELPGGAACGMLRVSGPDGTPLTGSPIDPGRAARYAAVVAAAGAGLAGDARAAAADVLLDAPVPAAFRGVHRPVAAVAGEAGPAVVIPVYGGRAETLACLDCVLDTVPPGTPVIVVDDASPDPALVAALDAMAAVGRVQLLRHDRNLGFPRAANTGMDAAAGRDVVLLNADTLVAPGWLEGLRAAAHAAPDIASATPFSNDATLLSYPAQAGGNPVPTRGQVERLARIAARAGAGGEVIEIPTAVGFCMYVRADAVKQVGLLRTDVFAQGYGEENDWCLRARHLGWRHVAAPCVFVGHVGGVSFGAARDRLLARNLTILNGLHPGYDALIAADSAGPALAAARRRLDLGTLARRPTRPAVALISHDLGGGVERQVQARAAALRAQGLTPILLRPLYALPLLAGTGVCRVELDPTLPNLVYATATELPALARLLTRLRVQSIELHHWLGHDHALLGLSALLQVPYSVHLHDYAWFCPRVTLVGFERRYCGEPPVAGCEACVADAGSNTDEDILVGTLIARSSHELAGAARLVAPSRDMATRMARHFPGLHADVEPWDDVRPPAAWSRAPLPRIVGVLGAIGIEKGYDVLLACARDAAARALPLRFVVLGHTTGDARLLDTGHVFITGEYRPEDLPGLIAGHQVQRAFLPSIWPETWCFTLSEAWRAGLHVTAFDIGAPAERIRAHGGGRLIPLGCGPALVNRALIDESF